MKVGKLKATLADQQMAEQRVAAMDMEVRRLSEDCGGRSAEVNHLCGLVDALGKERNHLQSEVWTAQWQCLSLWLWIWLERFSCFEKWLPATNLLY